LVAFIALTHYTHLLVFNTFNELFNFLASQGFAKLFSGVSLSIKKIIFIILSFSPLYKIVLILLFMKKSRSTKSFTCNKLLLFFGKL